MEYKIVCSKISIFLSIFIVPILIVASFPIFPNQRNSNSCSSYIWILFASVSIGFLVYETKYKRSFLIYKLDEKFHTFFKYWVKFLPNLNNQCPGVNFTHTEFEHNLLAIFFFCGFLGIQLWKISNLIYFAIIGLTRCINLVLLLENILKLIMATLIMVAINIHDTNKRSRNISIIAWSWIGSTCLGTVVKFIIEEVMWGYIDIVEKSIKDSEYGLNISSSIKHPDEYVENIYKGDAYCVRHVIDPETADYFLELIPFSTEFFCLSTFYALVKWKKIYFGRDINYQHHTNAAMGDEDQPDSNMFHICSSNCNFTLSLRTTVILIFLIIASTTTSIIFFFHETLSHNHMNAFWINISQQFIFQFLLLSSELWFYIGHLRKIHSIPHCPYEFELDGLMVVFPLIPLGIFLVIRTLPELLGIDQSEAEAIRLVLPYKWLQIFLNILRSIFNWVQVAFQAIFITDIFRRVGSSNGLHECKNFFLVLASLNFSVWLSFTLECKLDAIHGISFHYYGIVQWIVIVYSTSWMILFCFAHTTTCFLEVIRHIGKNELDLASERWDRESQHIIPELASDNESTCTIFNFFEQPLLIRSVSRNLLLLEPIVENNQSEIHLSHFPFLVDDLGF